MIQIPDTLYEALLEAGCKLDHRQSDLYVFNTPAALAIIKQHESQGTITNRTSFRAADMSGLWWELPFCYAPFWGKCA